MQNFKKNFHRGGIKLLQGNLNEYVGVEADYLKIKQVIQFENQHSSIFQPTIVQNLFENAMFITEFS